MFCTRPSYRHLARTMVALVALTQTAACRCGSSEDAYPAQLDALLNVVPDGADNFVVVRDPAWLLAAAALWEAPVTASLKAGDILPPFISSEPLALDQLPGKIDASGINLDRGAVLVIDEGSWALVYAADDPFAFPKLLTELEVVDDVSLWDCRAFPSHKGFAACGELPDALLAGKGAEQIREELHEHLPGVELDRAMLVAKLSQQGHDYSLTLEVEGGDQLLLNVGGDVFDDVDPLVPSEGNVLSLVEPSNAFSWISFDADDLHKDANMAPELLRETLWSLTGEALFGVGGDRPGLFLALQLETSTPAQRLLANWAGWSSVYREYLPGGLEIQVDTSDIGKGQAGLDFVGGNTSALGKLGMKPRGTLLATDDYFFIGLGRELPDLLPTEQPPEGPRKRLIDVLPKSAVADLKATKVSWLTRVPLEGLCADDTFASALSFIKQVNPFEDVDDRRARASMAALCPMESITTWIRHEDDVVINRTSIRLLGSPQSPLGEQVAQSIPRYIDGEPTTDDYMAMNEQFDDNHHQAAFDIRSGTRHSHVGVMLNIINLAALIIRKTEGYELPALRDNRGNLEI